MIRPHPGRASNRGVRSSGESRTRPRVPRLLPPPTGRSGAGYRFHQPCRRRRLSLRELWHLAASLCLCHGLTCLAVAGGRLLHPGDAQAKPLEAIRIRALLLLHAAGYPSGRDRSSGLGHPRGQFAESNRRHCELPATPLPRTGPSGRGRADDCIALTMRKSNGARSTSGAALLLFCRASDYWFATL
jgi:hypothetical protein